MNNLPVITEKRSLSKERFFVTQAYKHNCVGSIPDMITALNYGKCKKKNAKI